MITTFKVILLIIMCLSLMGVIAEDNKEKINSFLALGITSTAAFIVSVWWL